MPLVVERNLQVFEAFPGKAIEPSQVACCGPAREQIGAVSGPSRPAPYTRGRHAQTVRYWDQRCNQGATVSAITSNPDRNECG